MIIICSDVEDDVNINDEAPDIFSLADVIDDIGCVDVITTVLYDNIWVENCGDSAADADSKDDDDNDGDDDTNDNEDDEWNEDESCFIGEEGAVNNVKEPTGNKNTKELIHGRWTVPELFSRTCVYSKTDISEIYVDGCRHGHISDSILLLLFLMITLLLVNTAQKDNW